MKLYSMDECPWCEVVKKRLGYSKMEYDEIKDPKVLERFETVPRLELDNGEILDYANIISWINKQHKIKVSGVTA